jgi:small GTP-binding protein
MKNNQLRQNVDEMLNNRQQRHQHVSLTQSSRPSTTSAHVTFGSTSSGVLREKHRVVVMGAAQTGKSQIISQFLYDKFSEKYRQTIEELHRGEYELPDGSSLTLDILDTSGAFEFPAMRALSISTGNAFILVFSLNDKESFEEVKRLREEILEKRKGSGPVPIVVVGNKTDLHERFMSQEVVESIVSLDWECGYCECSAKENTGILDVFKELLVQAKIRYNLSPAVRRRRQSLPSFATSSPSAKFSLKRHSCTVA